jgi:hypothetical protein
VFGTYVLVWLILIAFGIVLGLILVALPVFWRNLLNNLVSGTLVAPFLALVATLIYYRLTAAHANEAYVSTSTGAPTAWEPPYPSTTPTTPPAGSPSPDAGPTDATDPSTTAPYPTPGPSAQDPAEPGPTEPGPATPPDAGRETPPPPPPTP